MISFFPLSISSPARGLLLALALLVPGLAFAKVKPPAWLAALAAKPATTEYGDADYVVLCDEISLEISPTGVITRQVRRAVRILTRDGESAALARLAYNTSGDKIVSLQGWLIRPDGTTLDYSAKHAVDLAQWENSREFATEARVRVIAVGGDSRPGSVFGYEATITEKTVFNQEYWALYDAAPVEQASFSITLPEGWKLRTQTFNGEPLIPAVNGRRQTWSRSQIPAVKEESNAPEPHTRALILAVDLLPPAPEKLTLLNQVFHSWPEVAAFFASLYDASSQVDDTIRARAESLVAGAATPWERMSRLAHYAQDVNYISIALNVQQGGGMKPRPATQVCTTNYGDCKDKATLLRALLRSQNIESFPVIVYSGDPSYVRPAWVSPLQFNHVILAIRVDESVEAPGVVLHPELGRLLIFDPTNEDTPLGWLPRSVLGGYALALGGRASEPFRLPTIQPAQNRTERTITARLEANGSIRGTITEIHHGLASGYARGERGRYSETDFRDLLAKHWFARGMPGARITRLETNDDFAAARFTLSLDFEAGGYGKMMRDTLMIFKPTLVSRRTDIAFKTGKRPRLLPIEINATAFTERAEIALPAGFKLDELPSPADLQAGFGTYVARVQSQEQSVIFERSLELRDTLIPAAEFAATRAYFEKIIQAEQAPVVLKRL